MIKKQNDQELINEFFTLMGNQEVFAIHNAVIGVPSGAAGVDSYLSKYYDIDSTLPFVLGVSGVNDAVGYLSLDVWKGIAESAFRIFFEDKRLFDTRTDKFHDLGKEVLKSREEFLSADSEKIRFDLLLKIIPKGKELNAISWLSMYMDKNLCRLLIDKYNIGISEERFFELWDKMIVPTFLSLDVRREEYILQSILSGDSFKNIAIKYHYFFQNYDGYTTQEFVLHKLHEQYGDFSKEGAGKKVDEIVEIKNRLKQDRESLTKTLSEQENNLYDFLQTVILIRDIRKDYLAAGLSVQFSVLSEICLSAGFDPKCANYVLYDEILEGPEYIKNNLNHIEKRKNGLVALVKFNGETEYSLIDEPEKIIKTVTDHFLKNEIIEQKDIKHIRGTVASTGIVSGVVRIIRDPRNTKFTEGDILVTGMTRPEFISLMKIAGAIVTDEGGITCHAAIVSRELKKPCIIGTKIATQVLKDGDVVEVDADKGVVRILEKQRIS